MRRGAGPGSGCQGVKAFGKLPSPVTQQCRVVEISESEQLEISRMPSTSQHEEVDTVD